ncbi:hypothetical protein HRbin30_00928 [bacterium HR30]|nr:hypothetical protein HRbin30_00928 [bacterium HR30]
MTPVRNWLQNEMEFPWQQGMRRYLPWLVAASAIHGLLLWLLGATMWQSLEPPTMVPVRIAIVGSGAASGPEQGAAPAGDEQQGQPRREEALEMAPRVQHEKKAQRSAQQVKAARPSRKREVPRERTELPQGVLAEGEGAMLREGRTAADSSGETGDAGLANDGGTGGNATGPNQGVGSVGKGYGGEGGGGGVGDARAYCAHCPPPVYPAIARQRSWSGVVRVWLELAQDGTVRAARVDRSSGYEVLDREALAAARRSRFRLPPEWSGTAAGIIEYRFELVP